MGKYVLAIDCGTQSLRGLIFDKNGKLLVKVKREFNPYYSVEPGWAEQDPNVYWNSLCEVCRQIKEDEEDVFNEIDRVVVTTQRDSCVLLGKNGEIIRPAILWMDQRKIEKPRDMTLYHKLTITTVGMMTTAKNFSLNCNAHWIQDYEPENWKKTHKYLQISGFLNYKLTHEFKDSIASQIGHIPFNYKHFRWEGKRGQKSQIFHIEREKLCDLVAPGGVIGYVVDEATNETGLKKGIPVIAGGSDKGCETLGVGCFDNYTASISLGSNASIQTTSRKYYEALRFICPFPAVIPKAYNPEIQIYRGYWMISWFKKEFAQKEVTQAKELNIAPEELLNKRLNDIPPGCDGLVFQPYWGAGAKRPEGKGAIIGFDDYHTRIHIYRAIIEGIGFGLFEGLQYIQKKSKINIQKIMVSGGGSQSDAICQITADLFNKPVYRVQTYETSGLGAAIVGYVSKGEYNSFDEAVKNMVHLKDEFLPDPANVQVYKNIYDNIYSKVYNKLKPLYKQMQK
ncbi:FGGY-family carbohydrate kinase [Vallitalea guaymasensis]|uniref:FGGY-family carbohydrate kinase n=1 Tax=Vallitalea guaymasensis TaxID=1185412 RepID=UPI000DE3D599|nr:FGGY-family carbohydrate kinase [Vallitalea guaymasensis]